MSEPGSVGAAYPAGRRLSDLEGLSSPLRSGTRPYNLEPEALGPEEPTPQSRPSYGLPGPHMAVTGQAG